MADNRTVNGQIAVNREARRKADAEAKAAAAAAEAARAQASAEEARARTASIQAEAAARQAELNARIKREEDARVAEALRLQRLADEKARAEKEAAERNKSLLTAGMQLGAIAGGIGIGKLAAGYIEKRHIKHLAAVAPQLQSLGTQAQRGLKPGKGGTYSAAQRNKLAGIVSAADRAKLTRIKGPLGGIMAAGLIADALVIRQFVAPNVKDETAQQALVQFANAQGIGALSMLTLRSVQNRTLEKLPPLRGAAAIESARRVVNAAPSPTAVNTVAAARRTMAAAQRATSTAGAVQRGVLSAVGAQPLATARRLAVRGGAVGAVAALGFAAANTDTGRRAWAAVSGYWRADPNTGRQAYVPPHTRRVG
jgi:hypothetical protein